jgi:hypothetical protein
MLQCETELIGYDLYRSEYSECERPGAVQDFFVHSHLTEHLHAKSLAELILRAFT